MALFIVTDPIEFDGKDTVALNFGNRIDPFGHLSRVLQYARSFTKLPDGK